MSEFIKKYSASQQAVPQFLSISQVAKTGLLPEFALRRFAAEGKLPGIYSGRKFLVNYNRLVEQLDKASGGRQYEQM